MNEQQLPAGRVLDSLVAEKIFGAQWWHDCNGERNVLRLPDAYRWAADIPGRVAARWADVIQVPSFSTDLAAAWQIVDVLHARGECVDIAYVDSLHDGMGWQAVFRMTGSWAFAKMPAHAICRAALIAASRLETPLASEARK